MSRDVADAPVIVSIIIPTYNESRSIGSCLHRLQILRGKGFEIIVSDGGSSDGTASETVDLVDHSICSLKGRSQQMNNGSLVASGKWLLFLHADTVLPDSIEEWLKQLEHSKKKWGFFRLRLSGLSALFRLIEAMINVRSTLSLVATGDQCLFVRNDLFREIGLFADIPLMEDVAISKTLRKRSKPMVWSDPVITSSRRWEQKGIVKTVLLMWGLRFAYFIGVNPDKLVKVYHG